MKCQQNLVVENVVKRENGNRIEPITAPSGLTNPLHPCKDGLAMPIQAEGV